MYFIFQAYPKDVASLRGIRKALGISVESVIGTDESQPIEIEDGDNLSQSNVLLQNEQGIPQFEAAYGYDNDDGHHNFIDNELLMETDGTVIDNLWEVINNLWMLNNLLKVFNHLWEVLNNLWEMVNNLWEVITNENWKDLFDEKYIVIFVNIYV